MRAFEAAARLGSFTAAAESLNVTQGAVSRQIKELEGVIGRPLFRRSGPRLFLTEQGRAFADQLAEIFADLQQAFWNVQGYEETATVTISTLPSVATRWLAARLSEFDRDFPDVDLKVLASRDLADFRTGSIDGAIRFGQGNWPEVEAEYIGGETVCPVCTPGFVAEHNLNYPEDLLQVRLFHSDMEEGWQGWFHHASVVPPPSLRGPQLGDDAATMQAVLNGQGVALGRTLLVADDLADGKLVQPFPVSLPISFGYWFVTEKPSRDDPHLMAVRSWLIERIRNTLEGEIG
ncbi:transcriptional regulator GcvA [Labrenzia sp. PHM005]|uniref:transcriptional regulator GcvA n=1 Tax=Labrenzia sp. PHM005 TaxID=2590016 RepID=UPI00143D1A6B|nr:transcriptional regulator GcvA [Labrenzia sp. PHM005]